MVTVIGGNLANAPSLASKDKGGRLLEVNRVEGSSTPVGGADDLEALILEFSKEGIDVLDLEERDFIGAAAGNIANRMGDPAGTLHGGENCGNTRAGGGAHAGPEIVGILHALQNKEERIFGAIQQIKKIILRFKMHHGGGLGITRGAFDFVNGIATHNEKLQELGLFFTVGFESGELPAFFG